MDLPRTVHGIWVTGDAEANAGADASAATDAHACVGLWPGQNLGLAWIIVPWVPSGRYFYCSCRKSYNKVRFGDDF